MKRMNRFDQRKGLTLIELLVVLVILVALAGILVPLLPDVQQSSHGASGADNMKEIAKAVQLHKATNGSFPNRWDSLIDDGGTLIGGATHLVVSDLSSVTDGDRIAEALLDAGIDQVLEHDSTSGNATFEPYADPPVINTIDATPSGDVATLTAAGEDALGLEPSVLGSSSTAEGAPIAYVAFGLGQQSTAVGESMLDAPVHFLEGGESPLEEYARWIVIFAVPEEGPLRIASVVALEEDELAGLSAHLNEYYESQE